MNKNLFFLFIRKRELNLWVIVIIVWILFIIVNKGLFCSLDCEHNSSWRDQVEETLPTEKEKIWDLKWIKKIINGNV